MFLKKWLLRKKNKRNSRNKKQHLNKALYITVQKILSVLNK